MKTRLVLSSFLPTVCRVYTEITKQFDDVFYTYFALQESQVPEETDSSETETTDFSQFYFYPDHKHKPFYLILLLD